MSTSLFLGNAKSKIMNESEIFHLKYHFQMAFTVDLKGKIVNVIGP